MIFRERLIQAIQEGILLTVKYGLIIFILIYSFLYLLNIQQMAINGEQAAIVISEYQKANILPKFPLPEKK